MRIAGILLSVCIAIWVVYATHRRLPEFSRWWSLTFWALIAAGVVLGFRLAGWEHNETPQLRVIGYPFRVVVVMFTGGEWHGEGWYHNNRAALTADIGLAVLVFILPFRAVQWLVQRCRQSSENNNL